MPKFTSFEMSEADYAKLESVAKAHTLGGLCVAISLEWLERINKDEPLPTSFAEENLDALAQQQEAYLELAGQSDGDKGFINYCKTRGIIAEQIRSGKADHGEIEGFDGIVLEPDTGYILSFSETDIRAQKAHVIALY